jgi:hypothetical protein
MRVQEDQERKSRKWTDLRGVRKESAELKREKTDMSRNVGKELPQLKR